MKFTLIFLFSFIAGSGLSQALPNDDFANRIVLTGDEVIFGGSLEGASRESGEPNGYLSFNPTFWWSWSAAHAGEATIEMLEVRDYEKDDLNGVTVWSGTILEELTEVAYNFLGYKKYAPHFQLEDTFRNHLRYVHFPVAAGVEYQISTSTSGGYARMRLVSHKGPHIVEPPRNQTVSVGQSVFLGVMASGILPLQYQWQRNGIDLAGETAPMLVFHHATTNQAGQYSVIVRNPNGTNTAISQLWVTTTPAVPHLHLAAVETNQLQFVVSGEVGRPYLLQSSTNLTDWTDIYAPGFYYPRKMVITSDGALSVSMPMTSTAKFSRASVYYPSNEVCVAQLQQVSFAKTLWANAGRKTFWDTPILSDLNLYWKGSVEPTCPINEDRYTFNSVEHSPTCLKEYLGHVLEEP